MKRLFPSQNVGHFCLLHFAFFFSAVTATSQVQYVKNTTSNPLQKFTVASNRQSQPVFVDIDGDGDQDCFSGEFNWKGNKMVSSHISFYKNIGDAKHPLFTQMKDASNPLSAIAIPGLLIPRFADIDEDGDEDCFIADNSGNISFYENTGNTRVAKFEQRSAAFNPLSGVKFSGAAISQFLLADVDKDGDVDCLISDEDGNTFYYQNQGGASTAKFIMMNTKANPFAFVINTNNGLLSFCSKTKQGNDGLFVNASYYENRYGHFSKSAVSPVLPSDDEIVSASWVDLNDDGNDEMIGGTTDGKFVCNTLATNEVKQPLSIVVSPNPATQHFTVSLPPSDEKRTLKIVEGTGKVIGKQEVSNSRYTFGDNFAPGVYFVQLYSGEKMVAEQKIIKQ